MGAHMGQIHSLQCNCTWTQDSILIHEHVQESIAGSNPRRNGNNNNLFSSCCTSSSGNTVCTRKRKACGQLKQEEGVNESSNSCLNGKQETIRYKKFVLEGSESKPCIEEEASNELTCEEKKPSCEDSVLEKSISKHGSSNEEKRQWRGFIDKNTPTTTLHPDIWGELPLAIQLLLVEYLPVPSLCRFRSVSKSWNEACRGVKHVKTHGKCYVTTYEEEGKLSIYSTADQAWLHLPLPGYIRGIATDTYIMASDSGLVAYASTFHHARGCVAISNPLFQDDLTFLPHDVPGHGHEILLYSGTEILQDSSGIIVFVRDEDGGIENPVIRVFHSKTDRWSSSVLRLGGDFVNGYHPLSSKSAALCGCTLYFFAASGDSYTANLFSTDVFDTSGCYYRESSAGWLVDYDYLLYPWLVVCSGKVVVVYYKREEETLELQVFDDRDKTCKSLSNKKLNDDLAYIDHVSAGKDEICVTLTTHDSIMGYIYDMSAGTWASIPLTGIEQTEPNLFPFVPEFH